MTTFLYCTFLSKFSGFWIELLDSFLPRISSYDTYKIPFKWKPIKIIISRPQIHSSWFQVNIKWPLGSGDAEVSSFTLTMDASNAWAFTSFLLAHFSETDKTKFLARRYISERKRRGKEVFLKMTHHFLYGAPSILFQIFPYSKKTRFYFWNSPLVNLAIKIKGGTLALVERERERERENK